MPFFKLRERIKLQDRPNHFIWLGPGIVEVDDTVAKHGFLRLVGEPMPDLHTGDEQPTEQQVVTDPQRPLRTINDLNPGKASGDPRVAAALKKLPLAPLKPFGVGPKPLHVLEAEAAARAIDAAAQPVVAEENPLVGTLPVKPVAGDGTSPPKELIKSGDPAPNPNPEPENPDPAIPPVETPPADPAAPPVADPADPNAPPPVPPVPPVDPAHAAPKTPATPAPSAGTTAKKA